MTHLQQIEQILFDMWMYDISVLTNVWMYIPLCVPAFLYVLFMTMKWSALTMPLWLPFSSVFRSAIHVFSAAIADGIKKSK